jgi:hypothetical protein
VYVSGWGDVHDPLDPDELPPGFWKWPREQRVGYYSAALRRVQIVAHIRSFIGSGTDVGPRAGAADRLTTEELAHVAADLGALPGERRGGSDER